MRVPSRQQAKEFLAEAEKMNPGLWVPHSRYAAEAAQAAAEAAAKQRVTDELFKPVRTVLTALSALTAGTYAGENMDKVGNLVTDVRNLVPGASALGGNDNETAEVA